MIKDLLKNFSTLAIGTLGSKLLALLIVPIYTSALSTTDIGKYDLINTVISMAIPLITLNIAEGVLRFLLDSKYDADQVKRVGHKYIWISVCIFTIVTIIVTIMGFGNITLPQMLIILSMYLSDVWYNYYLREKRGEGFFKGIAIAGILNTVVCFVLCCLFLLVLHFGVEGYAVTYVIGNAVAIAYLVFFCKKKTENIIIGQSDYKNVESEVLAYSKPLIINAISWWINDYSDRYIIIWLRGIAESGVYSVAYKIPSILNIIQTIFNQAWVVTTVKAEENGNFKDVRRVYIAYKSVLFIGCAGLLFITKYIASFLYAKDFFVAWTFTPYLITAIIYSSLSGCIGGILAAKKMTRLYALSTLIGAAVNIILNIVLVKSIGTMGAAIATLISCIVVYIVRVIYLRVKNGIVLNDIMQYLIAIPLFLEMMLVRFEAPLEYRVISLAVNIIINGYIAYCALFRKGKYNE